MFFSMHKIYSFLLIVSTLLLFNAGGMWGQVYEWEAAAVDGSRTGCVSPSKENVPEAIGVFEGGKYIAPDGKVYRKNSIVAKTARAVLDAQPKTVEALMSIELPAGVEIEIKA